MIAATVALSLEHLRRAALPGANAPGVKPPLLVLLHGVGANERAIHPIAAAFDPRYEVVSARSPVALGPDAYGWFHVQFTPTGPVIDAAEARAGWALLARFIDEAVVAYGADPSRVHVVGFSQGGIMALAGLLTAPDRIAGAVVMSGRLLPEVLPFAAPHEALRGKPLLIVHGTGDQKLGVHFARSARQALGVFPLDLTYDEQPMGHEITRESLARVAEWCSALLDRPTSRA